MHQHKNVQSNKARSNLLSVHIQNQFNKLSTETGGRLNKKSIYDCSSVGTTNSDVSWLLHSAFENSEEISELKYENNKLQPESVLNNKPHPAKFPIIDSSVTQTQLTLDSNYVLITSLHLSELLSFCILPTGLMENIHTIHAILVTYFYVVVSTEWFTTEKYGIYAFNDSIHSSQSDIKDISSMTGLRNQNESQKLLLFWMDFDRYLYINKITLKSATSSYFEWSLLKSVLTKHQSSVVSVLNIIPCDTYFHQKVPKAIHRYLLRRLESYIFKSALPSSMGSKDLSLSDDGATADVSKINLLKSISSGNRKIKTVVSIKIARIFAMWLKFVTTTIGLGIRVSSTSEWSLTQTASTSLRKNMSEAFNNAPSLDTTSKTSKASPCLSPFPSLSQVSKLHLLQQYTSFCESSLVS